MDCGILPCPVICITCGGANAPCYFKIIGPTIGFLVAVVLALFFWPAALLCGCCATDLGKRFLAKPADVSRSIADAFPI